MNQSHIRIGQGYLQQGLKTDEQEKSTQREGAGQENIENITPDQRDRKSSFQLSPRYAVGNNVLKKHAITMKCEHNKQRKVSTNLLIMESGEESHIQERYPSPRLSIQGHHHRRTPQILPPVHPQKDTTSDRKHSTKTHQNGNKGKSMPPWIEIEQNRENHLQKLYPRGI